MERVATFEVLAPGALTTLQDLGRFGYSQFGVPASGAVDTLSLRIGNLLVENRGDEACLEITLMGLRLKALGEVVIAMTGGDLCPMLNEEPLEMWKAHILIEGDILTFKKVLRGCRAYLAVQGGFAVPPIMGSRSTYISGKFGGLEGRALKRGDLLYTYDIPTSFKKLGQRLSAERIPHIEKEVILRVVPGPQDSHFTERGFQTLYGSSYQVTPQCDRMGIRLDGPRIERRPDVEESIISEGFLAGAIQVPGDGKPIIILSELVTGGYTKIATVISTDLTKVAQLKPGDRVRFEPVSVEEAHRLLKEQEAWVQSFKDSLLT